ncbi:YcdB/YcdC domain-containing protein [Paenibacillus caseinilyticus]|uniref:S-layer protein n=1 Tax=Paenibacillus mucilaginosus K02 TaxID=997761 RepID=I0BAK0_9BACL|nr:YcdB/YcdC domain-containing protein [Paenibacillus mucilaginosus]AFH59397.2 S-layer protein [Paenibacillus mucilaginosus K02]
MQKPFFKPWGIAGLTTALLLTSAASPLAAMTPDAASKQTSAVLLPAAGPSAPAKEALPAASDAPVNTAVSRERAIELAGTYVTIPTDYKLQSVNYQVTPISGGSARGAWHLSFVKQDAKGYYGSISVTVDSDNGGLLSYQIYDGDPDRKPSFPPQVSLDKAKTIAEAHLAKMLPKEQSQLTYALEDEKNFRKPLSGETQYPLRWVRSVNGIPFYGNEVRITVDGDGRIISYSKQWDESLAFAPSGTPVAADKAADTLQEATNPRLQYVTPYNAESGAQQLYVAYTADPLMVDAATGEVLTLSGGKPAPAVKPVPLSDKPLAELPSAPLKLTKEQAVERITGKFTLPKEAKLEDASYREYTDPRTNRTTSAWDLRWSVGGSPENGGRMIYASVDSSTGVILAYSPNDFRPLAASTDTAGADLTSDELKSRAEKHLREILPAYVHELYLDPQNEASPEWTSKLASMPYYPVNYRRIVGGIPTEYESVSLSLDRKTGEIKEFHSNLSTIPYPAEPPKVIAEDEARKLLLGQYDIKLQYVIDYKGKPSPYGYDGAGGMPVEKYNVMAAAGEIAPTGGEKLQTRLVYGLVPKFTEREQQLFLDGESGKWRSRESGRTVDPFAAPPADIAGHWAEEALNLMIDYGALEVTDGKVRPDGLITRGEMVKMLLAAVNGGYMPLSAGAYAERAASFADVAKDSKYFAYVENAADRGLIDRTSGTFQPDASLSRADLAELLVRAMGYRKLAQTEGLFVLQATDLENGAAANPGAVALVNGLGIMTLEDGKFRPKTEMTRAQAATAFYKYLQVRAELQDSPVNPRW